MRWHSLPAQHADDGSGRERDPARARAAVVSAAGTVARILDARGALLALGRADGEHLHPFKVFLRRNSHAYPFIHFKTRSERCGTPPSPSASLTASIAGIRKSSSRLSVRRGRRD